MTDERAPPTTAEIKSCIDVLARLPPETRRLVAVQQIGDLFPYFETSDVAAMGTACVHELARRLAAQDKAREGSG